MKVLLFSNDLMPFGNLPTSGGGLRCYQIMKGLQHHGIEVIASMPGFTYLAEKHFQDIPQEQKDYLWQFDTQDDIFARVKPDAVIFASNWDHFNLSKKLTVPLIIDLHGSRLIETAMWDRPISPEKKVSILSKADCLLAAGRRQRNYFYGWLVQAGRFPGHEHFIRYIPVSLSPDLPARKTEVQHLHKKDIPIFVSGGGWFPWQNQSKTIFSIAKTIERKNRGHIQIYGTPHERTGTSLEEQNILEIYARVEDLARKNQRINVCGYVGREELLAIYANADVAVEAMSYNLERELAFTTRTIEYLWCGLPVIYNNFGEISEHIKEYDAGWTVDPDNEQDIQTAIDQIFAHPEIVEKKSANARRLVQDRFTWDKTIQPLVDYLHHPIKEHSVEPVMGTVYTRPSFLQAKGDALDISLLVENTPIYQRFVVPADNISAVELPARLTSSNAREKLKYIELKLQTMAGRTICRRRLKGQAIPVNGQLTLNFPILTAPAGGEEVKYSLKLVASESYRPGQPSIVVRGISQVQYPLVMDENSKFSARDADGKPQLARGLALSFMPAEFSTLYKVKMLSSRAAYMMKKGEWKRLVRAIRRRLPQLAKEMRS